MTILLLIIVCTLCDCEPLFEALKYLARRLLQLLPCSLALHAGNERALGSVSQHHGVEGQRPWAYTGQTTRLRQRLRRYMHGMTSPTASQAAGEWW